MARPPSDRRERILKAAITCFSTQAYPDVKLDQVAEQAGVAKGTIYLYFRTKDDLFCQCLLDDAPHWISQTEKIIHSAETAAKRLHRMVVLQSKAYQLKGPLIQSLLQMGPTFPLSTEIIARLHDHLRQVVARYASLFQDGLAAGEFSDRFTATQMAIIFIQIFDLNVKFQMFQVPLLRPDDVYDALMKLFGPT
ncbi:MAG TPA: TetR/AcrR family transcriptional regulator [Candidatus Ozemobacteraceae bacterium]|nr:TetR/AcrR family transcriptional regulator [Candidatus Ozemobacteraceae bacterium]